MWDAATGATVQTFEVGAVVSTLSFSSDGSCVETDRGRLDGIYLHSSASYPPLLRPVVSHKVFVRSGTNCQAAIQNIPAGLCFSTEIRTYTSAFCQAKLRSTELIKWIDGALAVMQGSRIHLQSWLVRVPNLQVLPHS